MKNVRKGMKIMRNPHILHTLPHILRTLKFNNFSIFFPLKNTNNIVYWY